jgi:NADH:ubiquinone oxidoreductase subunit 4 (subunit M)
MLLGTTKVFADVSFKEGLALVSIIAVLFFFGMYPKPIRLDYTKFRKYFNSN